MFIVRGGTTPPSADWVPLRNFSEPQTTNARTTIVTSTWVSEKWLSWKSRRNGSSLRPSNVSALWLRLCHHEKRLRKSNQVPCSPMDQTLVSDSVESALAWRRASTTPATTMDGKKIE